MTVSVDLTEPRRVLAWTVPHRDALQTLTDLFGEEWVRGVGAALASGTTAVPAPPLLPEPWARLGLVAGVQRWMPAPIPEATVGIDHALASHGAGLAEQASAEFAAGAASLLYRAEQFLNGELPRAMRPDLLAATRTAAQVLADGHPDAAYLHDLAVELEAAVGVNAASRAVGEGRLGAGPAVHVGVSAPAAAPDALVTACVDPALVPARILRWDGAEAPELLVETYTDPLRLRISAVLADDTEPDDQEVTELVARVLDPSEGTVRGSGVFLPAEDIPDGHGRRIVADLPLYAGLPERPVVQVYQAGRRHPLLGVIRDPGFVRVDRLMLEAWMLHRLALAAYALNDSASETLMQEAAHRARWAAAALEDLAVAYAVDASAPEHATAAEASLAGLWLAAGRPTAPDLQARTAAINAYLTVLDAALTGTPGAAQGQATQPLLAELELLATREVPTAAAVMIRDIEAWLTQAAHREHATLAPEIVEVAPIRLPVPMLISVGYASDVLIKARVDRAENTARISFTLTPAHNAQPLIVVITAPDGAYWSAEVNTVGRATVENVPITSGDLRIRLELRS
ncbi:hypothetical protein [Nonomuraea sp. NPDC049400]|uniref:hypothetical protein n=1 Tax=Nonomuraea sp. NPDC049400 TaxID=3364352 RepID=UPI00379B2235